MSAEMPASSKWFFLAYSAAIFSMATFGAKPIGAAFPSIPLLFGVGFALSLTIVLIPAVRKYDSPELSPNYLGHRYPLLPLFVASCFALASWLLVAGRTPTQPSDFVWAYLGGCMAFAALHQLYIWSQIRKTGNSK